MLKFQILILIIVLNFAAEINAVVKNPYVVTNKVKGGFPLSYAGSSASLYFSSKDFPGVYRVLKQLQNDIKSVTGAEPLFYTDTVPSGKEIVIAGTIGKNPLLDKLIENNKINVDEIKGRWETFIIQIIENPFPSVDRALVIAGSDKRGTIFGIYDLSENFGVSPWYWWADVPVIHKKNLFVLPGSHSLGEPKVKYRGIFINDEAPALSGWVYEKFGGFNSKFYDKVFELILRLKGNFLWPAMWGNAFYVDDPENPKLADEYGVVIGTSHHEPMMRAHAEWAKFGSGPWNYEKNENTLKDFWKTGIERMGSNESLITVGMRGDGDEPMTENANIALLERIIKDQRKIISDVTKKDASTVPQVWALYKEVQEYYDKGMNVPDDITLLLCDDNWGNIRKLPKLNEKPRPGGYGIYYHYDYVGDPRNYKWLNTNQISRVWEQMHLAYEYGVDRIWIVNVGDIKPMEFPISFFLDYAWNPDKITADSLPGYNREWAAEQFGNKFSSDIAEILNLYTKYNSRRKPELLEPQTYSLVNGREAETIVSDYKSLEKKADKIYNFLPPEYRDAFFQLVLHPVEACSNLNELYYTTAKNLLYAKQGRAETNSLTAKVKELFDRDSAISYRYNKIVSGGKWNHMMDQTHIGYTYWQQPDVNSIPVTKTIAIPSIQDMGVAIEGSESWWPDEKKDALLPEFDSFNRQSYYIEIFNRGQKSFNFSITSEVPWIVLSSKKGMIKNETRLTVSINWKKAPAGEHSGFFTVKGPDKVNVIVHVTINNQKIISEKFDDSYIESNGYISIEAENYSHALNSALVTWQRIPDIGRTLSGMTPFPVTFPAQSPERDSPRLEYKVYLFHSGKIKIKAYLSPTLNFNSSQGLRYAVSFDNEIPHIINISANKNSRDWGKSVSDNITTAVSEHQLAENGVHVLKLWAIDPGIVLQKIEIGTSEFKNCYLGQPESYKVNKNFHSGPPKRKPGSGELNEL
jgi:hypothetical protein